MHLDFHFKNKDDIFCVHEEKTPFLSFRALDKTELFINAFSTRLGGVSEGVYAEMNLTYAKAGEKPAHVLENYRRLSEACGFDYRRAVVSQQTHTTNVRRVSEADAGKGVIRERDYTEVDGLVTDVPGLTLVTFYADCVPLYIADPVHKAIGLSHSGWRGTAARMGAVTVKRMQAEYGSRPEDLICCIGPSICRDCFEVGAEVAEIFRNTFETDGKKNCCLSEAQGYGKTEAQRSFPEYASYSTPLIYDDRHRPLPKGGPLFAEKKYFVDLWEANRRVFLEAGVRAEHIAVSNLCTHCNPALLWSHRSFGEKRGNLAAFLCIK